MKSSIALNAGWRSSSARFFSSKIKYLGLAVMLSGVATTASAACDYTISNQWSTGFTASIKITNNTSSAVSAWNVAWQYSGADRITNSWSANVSGTNPYAATNMSWNGSLQPGQSAEFGFQGTKTAASAEIAKVTGSLCASVTSSVSSSSVVSSSSTSSSVASSSIASSSSSVISSSSVMSSSSKTSSSVVSSSSVANSSSSALSSVSGQQCNWYGSLYPLCATTTSGWGYENGKSCISVSTCASQPAPYGVVGATSSTSSSTPVSSSSSSLSSQISSVPESSSSSSMTTSSSSSVANSSSSSSASSVAAGLNFRGVSLAGAEFGEGSLPGTYAKDYIYPDQNEVDYFKGKSMNTLRLPFRWERLQRSLGGEFDTTELARLDGFVTATTAKGVYVVLDPHNYARYNGNLIGGGTVTNAHFADFWSRLAIRYKGNSKVIFALMNEPNTMATEQWVSAANAAIQAIRTAGATNFILVPGNAWTGGWSWNQTWYGTANATAMLSIVDSGNNYAFEVHQYLDGDASGTSSTCVSTTIGVERLTAFTAWLNTNGKRGFLGEFAGGNNATCKEAVQRTLQYLQDNNNVWTGWTWWAAGPWWAEYMYTLEPASGVDRPQMSWLTPYLF